MRLLTLITLPLLLLASTAQSQEDFSQVLNNRAGFFDIQSLRIERLDSTDATVPATVLNDYRNDCSELGRGGAASEDSGNIHETSDVSIEQIVNAGKEAWNFIKNNRPVINATTQYAHALPRGSACWDDLENWQRPRSEYYKITYNNGFGLKVVSLEFRLVYNYGGQVNNKGHFISNATIQYSKINVKWGFEVNAGVEVPLVVNVGSKEDPIAGMQLSIRWSVRSFHHIEQTASFFIYGDGRPTDVL